MADSKKEVKAGAFYLAGNIVSKAVAFLTIPVFTRLLTTSEYGIVNTYSSWVQIVSVIMTLSLFNSFRTAVVEKKDDFDAYCASVLRLGGIFSILWTAAAVIGIFVSPVLRKIWWMVICCIIQAYGTFCVALMSTRYMLLFRYKKRAVFMIVPNTACAAMAVILLLANRHDRCFWRITAYVAVYAAFILISLWVMRKEKTDVRHWSYAVRYSLPLVLHGLSLIILSASDRIMITHMRGPSESGIYSLAYNLGLIATAVISSIEGIWLPWFIKKMKDGKTEEINEKAAYLIENAAAVTVIVMLTAPELLQVMSPDRYWPGKPVVFPVIAASYIVFLYDIVVNVEYQAKATKEIAVNTAAAAVFNIALNFIFIPRYGAVAAAYTTAASYIFSMAMHMRSARRYCSGIFPLGRYAACHLAVAVFAVLGSLTRDIRFAAVRWPAAAVLSGIYLFMMFAKKRFVALQIRI